MATKVDQASSVEPRRVQTTAMSTSSAASTSSPKVSKFGVKSGFVIPKNKLSGALVRSGGKMEGNDTAKEEGTKQVQRKTKWGTDLTEDAAVRRGRALAYQTRVEQITQQLKPEDLETGDDQGSRSPTQVPNHDSSSQQIDDEFRKLEMLELERREAIGEILNLNPNYKVPPDYKPLLREAKVPIPLKLYPGYNFIGLILGPGSNTQKRLEEETGAKIRIHGTKSGTGEKGEITLSDGNEIQSVYEELYVHVSADTYEKVDAAVALIELLVAPVSGNSVAVSTTPTSVSGDTVNVFNQSQKDSTTSYMMPIAAVNQGMVQPIVVPTQPGAPQVQFQPYPGTWLPLGPPHTPMRPPSGFVTLPNSPASMPNNAIRFPPSPVNPSNMSPFFVGRPPTATGFVSVPGNPSLLAPRPLPPMQGLQRPYMPEARSHSHVLPPRNHIMPGPQPPQAYHAVSARPSPAIPHQFTGNQPTPTGPAPVARPLMPSMQTVSAAPRGSIPNRPLTHSGSSTGWSSSPVAIPASLGLSNMMQMAQTMVLPHRPHHVVPQPVVSSVAVPSNVPATGFSRPPTGNLVSPATFPSQPSTSQFSNTPVNHPATAPTFASVPPQVRPGLASTSVTPSLVAAMPTSFPSAVPSPASGPFHAQSSMAASTPTQPSVFARAPVPVLAQATVPAPASSPGPIQSSSPVAHMQPVVARGPVPNQSANPILGSAPVPLPLPSTSPQPQSGTMSTVSGSVPSFTPIKPPMTSQGNIPPVTAPKPQRPSSGDFTFQPLRSQLPASQAVSRSSNQPIAQNAPPMPPKPAVQPPPAPQAPSFRPALHNSAPQLAMQGFPSPQASKQMVQPQAPVPPPSPRSVVPFAVNPSSIRPPPRLPAFPNPNPLPPTTPVPKMGPPRNFTSAPQMSNIPGSLPTHLANPLQLQQNQLAPTARPGSLLVPQFNNNPTFASGKLGSSPGGNQVYDPFSPTSISPAQQQGDNPAKARKQENDPEYEDLMASVGVR